MSATNEANTQGRSLPRKAVVWAFRLAQVLSVGAAGVFVLGSIMAGQNVFQFMVVGIVAIVLLLVAIVLEFGARAVR
jgi:hypothetical protein